MVKRQERMKQKKKYDPNRKITKKIKNEGNNVKTDSRNQ
jgi:hypothetical protein